MRRDVEADPLQIISDGLDLPGRRGVNDAAAPQSL